MEASSSPEKSRSANSGSSQSGQKGILSFEELYIQESRQLKDEVHGAIACLGFEPWIAFTPRDRFGLALSGGGIRSATFNLGLLQAFAYLGVLKHVEYLSTVSGGGYIGGFWMAWLRRKGDAAAGPEHFPLAKDQSGEPAEVRHLREFSRFGNRILGHHHDCARWFDSVVFNGDRAAVSCLERLVSSHWDTLEHASKGRDRFGSGARPLPDHLAMALDKEAQERAKRVGCRWVRYRLSRRVRANGRGGVVLAGNKSVVTPEISH
jgi:hypothetical protein